MNLRCQTCGAQLVVEQGHRTALCPYCGAPSVVERPPDPDRPAPAFALGFSLTEATAKERVSQWLRSRSIFADGRFKRAAVENMKGVYLPAYLYSAVARAEYSAMIGENYTEVQTYTTVSKGKVVKRTRTVVKTEWRPLSGRFAEYVADVLVTASKGLPNEELEQIEPFDLRVMRRYTPALVSGWIAEDPSMTRDECLALARKEAAEKTRAHLAAFMPGDSHRDLEHTTQLENEALDLCLVPVWVGAVRHDADKPPVRILVNGQSGEVVGKVPLSWKKIAAAIAGGLLLVGGLVLLLLHLNGELG